MQLVKLIFNGSKSFHEQLQPIIRVEAAWSTLLQGHPDGENDERPFGDDEVTRVNVGGSEYTLTLSWDRGYAHRAMNG